MPRSQAEPTIPGGLSATTRHPKSSGKLTLRMFNVEVNAELAYFCLTTYAMVELPRKRLALILSGTDHPEPAMIEPV